MTPRKWFMNKIAFQWASDEEMPSRFQVKVRNPDAEDTPVYVFTEEELRKLWNTADQIGWRKGRDQQIDPNVQRKYTSFDDYLNGAMEVQQKFGGGE